MVLALAGDSTTTTFTNYPTPLSRLRTIPYGNSGGRGHPLGEERDPVSGMARQTPGQLQLQESGVHRGRGEWTGAQQFVNRDGLGAQKLEQDRAHRKQLAI